MIRHLVKESTSTFFFSEVMKRSGSALVEGQNALVEIAHVLDHRPLEVQAGLLDDFADLAELEDDRVLPLIDREDGRTEHHQHGDETAAKIFIPAFISGTPDHAAAAFSRERASPFSTTCGGTSLETADGRARGSVSGLPPAAPPPPLRPPASACRAAGRADCPAPWHRPAPCWCSNRPAAWSRGT
jgi:hypothetical protein